VLHVAERCIKVYGVDNDTWKKSPLERTGRGRKNNFETDF
jgi:hypothetical protein